MKHIFRESNVCTAHNRTIDVIKSNRPEDAIVVTKNQNVLASVHSQQIKPVESVASKSNKFGPIKEDFEYRECGKRISYLTVDAAANKPTIKFLKLRYIKCGEAVETAKYVIFDCPALCRRRSSYLEVVQEEGRQWPALSPDANPIELQTWDMLGRRIRSRVPISLTLNELQHVYLEEWELIPQEDIRHLILVPQVHIRARILKLTKVYLEIDHFFQK
nr:unnamed protein product [Callosobruchus chinensis]